MPRSTRSKARFIPALSAHWLTPAYDPLIRWGMREQMFKRRLVHHAGITSGKDVLDLGCGTGTLTLMLKRSAPRAHITGLDGDPAILAIARRKALDGGVCIQWDEALACALPYLNRSFDVVVSSLVIHHLATDDKARAFQEVHRVLRPGGMFLIADFGRPFSTLTRLQAAVMRNLEEAADNIHGRLTDLLRAAGFDAVREFEPLNTLFGPLWFYESYRPAVRDVGQAILQAATLAAPIEEEQR